MSLRSLVCVCKNYELFCTSVFYWIGSRLPDYDYDYEDAASDDLLDTGAFVNRGLDSDNLLSDEEEYQRQHQLQQHQQLQQRQQQRAGKIFCFF